MEQKFEGPVDSVAGRDVVQNGQHGGVSISMGDHAQIEQIVVSESKTAGESDDYAIPLRQELEPIRERVAAARAELQRRFLLHPTVFGFLIPWSLMVGLMLWTWNDPLTFEFSVFMLGLAFLIVVPATLVMTISRRAIHAGLVELRGQLRQIERDLEIASAYQRTRPPEGR